MSEFTKGSPKSHPNAQFEMPQAEEDLVQAWKDEYLGDSRFCDVFTDDPVKLVELSLQKFLGLKEEILHKHGLVISNNCVMTKKDHEVVLRLGADDCLLCKRYMDSHDNYPVPRCTECPIYCARGGVACDTVLRDDHGERKEDDHPYNELVMNHDPHPMTAWLKRALIYEKRRQKLLKMLERNLNEFISTHWDSKKHRKHLINIACLQLDRINNEEEH